MTENTSPQSPQKKYWWLLLFVLPIALALIAILPDLIKTGPTQDANNTPSANMQTQEVEQSTKEGNNFSNVQGNISINEVADQGE